MRRALVLTVSAVLALALLLPGRAEAVPGLGEVWTAGFSYVPHVVILSQGNALTFSNHEPSTPVTTHTVTDANVLIPGATVRFSASAPPGQTTTVVGTASLARGAYPFVCVTDIIHTAAPGLKGLLVVV